MAVRHRSTSAVRSEPINNFVTAPILVQSENRPNSCRGPKDWYLGIASKLSHSVEHSIACFNQASARGCAVSCAEALEGVENGIPTAILINLEDRTQSRRNRY